MTFRFRQSLLDLNEKQVYLKLIKIIQKIEVFWQDDKKRQRLLRELKGHLSVLKDHPESELHWLYRLSERDFRKMNLQAFLSLVVPIERKYGLNLTDPDFLISSEDAPPGNVNRVPLIIIVENLRSTYNVGSIFRTAECLAAEQILLCGYTSTPESSKTIKTAMGTDQHVAWEYLEETEEALSRMKERNIPVIALETVKDAPSIFSNSFPRPCALLVGNEKYGLSSNILAKVDNVLQIPVYGWKNSLNVGIALGICGYEIRRQWGTQDTSTNLI